MNVKIIILAFAAVICQANGQLMQQLLFGNRPYSNFLNPLGLFTSLFRPPWYQQQQQQQQQQPNWISSPLGQFMLQFRPPMLGGGFQQEQYPQVQYPQVPYPQVQYPQQPPMQYPEQPLEQYPYEQPSFIPEQNFDSEELVGLPEDDVASQYSEEANYQPFVPEQEGQELSEDEGHVEQFPDVLPNGQAAEGENVFFEEGDTPQVNHEPQAEENLLSEGNDIHDGNLEQGAEEENVLLGGQDIAEGNQQVVVPEAPELEGNHIEEEEEEEEEEEFLPEEDLTIYEETPEEIEHADVAQEHHPVQELAEEGIPQEINQAPLFAK